MRRRLPPMKPTLPNHPSDPRLKQDAEFALMRLKQESRRYTLQGACSMTCWILAIVLLVLSVGASAPGHGPPPLLLLCLLCLAVGAGAMPSARSRALAMLAEQQDVRSIGPLLEALEVFPEAKREAILVLLITLLPRLTPSDAALLNRTQRRKLYTDLILEDPDRNESYLQAVLKGIEQIGEEEALYWVRRLVQRGATTPGQSRIWEAASACLLRLEARLERRNDQTCLLRAAVGGNPSHNASELLRPVTSETNDPGEG